MIRQRFQFTNFWIKINFSLQKFQLTSLWFDKDSVYKFLKNDFSLQILQLESLWFDKDPRLQFLGTKIQVFKFLDQERFQFTNFWNDDFSLQLSGSRKMLVYKNYN